MNLLYCSGIGAAGAVVMYRYSRISFSYQGRDGRSAFELLTNRPVSVVLLQMVIFAAAGAIFAAGVLEASDFKSALLGGMAAFGLLTTILEKNIVLEESERRAEGQRMRQIIERALERS